MARLAIDFVSGPGGIASALRRTLLGAPLNGKSVLLDVGYSDHIPAAIRHAVIQRDKHCAWPPAATAPPPSPTSTTSPTKKTAAPPASTTACSHASTTTTSASTAGDGKSNAYPTEPSAPPDPKDRPSKATRPPPSPSGNPPRNPAQTPSRPPRPRPETTTPIAGARTPRRRGTGTGGPGKSPPSKISPVVPVSPARTRARNMTGSSSRSQLVAIMESASGGVAWRVTGGPGAHVRARNSPPPGRRVTR